MSPRTRSDIERDAKVEEIVALAEARLRDGGYDALSVAAMARELGVAQNAIYWYFASKDHLFVAAMERMLRGLIAGKPREDTTQAERILWFTDQFGELSALRGAMSERARHSPVVAEFVAGLEATLTRMLTNALRNHVPDENLPLTVDAFRAAVEGTYAKGLDSAERRRVLAFSLERLMGGPGATG